MLLLGSGVEVSFGPFRFTFQESSFSQFDNNNFRDSETLVPLVRRFPGRTSFTSIRFPEASEDGRCLKQMGRIALRPQALGVQESLDEAYSGDCADATLPSLDFFCNCFFCAIKSCCSRRVSARICWRSASIF